MTLVLMIGGWLASWLGLGLAPWIPTTGFIMLLVTLASVSAWKSSATKAITLENNLRPRLVSKCGKDVVGCVKNNVGNRLWRIAVDNDSDKDIPNCRASLISITCDGVAKWNGDNAILTFQPAEEPDAQAKTLYFGKTEYVDVVWCYDDRRGNVPWGFATKKREWPFMPTLLEIFEDGKEYVLTVLITGDGAPVHPVDLKFVFDRNPFARTLEKMEPLACT